MTDSKEYPVCLACGSQNVKADAYAEWNHKAQAWEISATFDKGSVCEDCDGETSIEWRAGDPPDEDDDQ